MSKRGKIYSVACNDFVTYDEVMFLPGEYLNIIIGPNGTGKSTLVSAIVLGMGGRPEILSRSSALTDWIKHGCDEALIEIHVYKNETETTSFQRQFNQDGMDEYKIDGKKYSRKQFLLKVKEYNIQVDNLCQFLPQDRVQDFAKMNEQELLANTQISVCTEEVQQQYQQLVELRQKQLDVDKDEKTRQKEVEDLQAKNESLRPQIENIQARGDLVKDVEMLNRKIAWIEYEQCDVKVVEYTNDLNQAQTKLSAAEKKLEPVKKEADSIVKERKKMENLINSERDAIAKLKETISKQQDQLARLTSEMQNAKGELHDAVVRARDRKNEIAQASTILLAVKQDLANLLEQQMSQEDREAQISQLDQRFKEISQQKRELTQKRSNLKFEIDALENQRMNITNRVQNMENVERRKLEKLKNGSEQAQSAYAAAMWLRENRQMFKGHIYDPIVLELRLDKQDDAKFLENTVQLRDFFSFGCENADDLELFLREMRVKHKLQVSAYHADGGNHLLYHSTYPISQMQRFGFQKYLIDTIKGPAPVLNFLCKTYRIQDVPICDESTGMKIGNLPKEIRVVYTPTKRFQITISKYSGNVSSSASDVRSRNILDTSVDPGKIAEQKQQLTDLQHQKDQKSNEIARIEDKLRQIEDKAQVVNQAKRTIEDSGNAVRVAAEKVKRQQQKFDQLQQQVIDIPAEKEKFKQRAEQIVNNIFRVHEAMNNSLREYVKPCITIETQSHKLQLFRNVNQEIEEKIHMLQEEVTRSKRLKETIQQHVNNARNEMKAKEAKAKKLTDNKHPKDKNFPYKADFAKLPSDHDELVQAMTQLQARIDCMGAFDQNIIDEYEQRQEQIDAILREIRGSTNRKNELQQQIDAIHVQWYATISGVVRTINDNFSRFMSLMNLAGEVELSREGEHDYTKYGITIRVKYRAQDPMAKLDRTYQSGGERAVAIGVYTLSLQQLSHVPFRCVDEINQGMDPKNERKIFEMLVNETCQVGQSQYFFVTPKLLPNLAFNELMNVFIVENGKFIDDPYLFVKHQIEG
ncbi:structural maintenance of chromosomes protein 5 [Culicoides brevitarsis]|uniref:structural maintenance of chromosomes protein 5 n=1 Tax=Culicoides brevitarsis TaxID=469753 RepID=UPI00307CA703